MLLRTPVPAIACLCWAHVGLFLLWRVLTQGLDLKLKSWASSPSDGG